MTAPASELPPAEAGALARGLPVRITGLVRRFAGDGRHPVPVDVLAGSI